MYDLSRRSSVTRKKGRSLTPELRVSSDLELAPFVHFVQRGRCEKSVWMRNAKLYDKADACGTTIKVQEQH